VLQNLGGTDAGALGFACGAWGYLAAARERWQEERPRPAARGPQVPSRRPPAPPEARPPTPRAPAPALPDLAQQLATFQAALPGSRVVVPHTTPDGGVVNLYGRAVGTAAQVPKAKRHDHLPGEKGYFNASALQGGADPRTARIAPRVPALASARPLGAAPPGARTGLEPLGSPRPGNHPPPR
jgi:hypothetical protein